MNGIQLDLFTFAAMQIQEKSAEAKSAVMLKNFINDGKHPLPTAKRERIAANLKAIRLLKSLSDDRPLKYDEQITLSRFTGWGGLTDVFMEGDPNFAELKELLTKEEYETAESSMLDSYYTPENIIDFMWTLSRQKLGVKTGKVAELGCGTGNFIGYAPMQKGYQFTGVEIDKISGNIAKRLYPESTIHINSLEKVKLSDNFDLVIGNVPFGRFAPYDPQFRSYNSWNLHNYFIAKALEQRKRSLKSRLDRLEDRHAVEDMIYFDELGIDSIFIDEVHSYKRNFFITKMSRVKGLDNGASQKAFSLTLKLNHIREKTAGRNIYTATGTPVTNTLAELWNMVRYVSPETLEDFHVDTFDRFASTFALSETALEINAAGRLKMVTRFAKYTNVVELSKMFRSCADVILPEDLKGIPKPPIKGGHPEQIKLPRTAQVSSFMDYLADLYSWFEKLDNSEKKHFSHIPLMIYGFRRKATIDLRLVAENAVDDPGSKLNVCVEKILEKYRDYDSIKGAQVVFSDLYQLSCGKIAHFDVFREIKRKLVDRGIPTDEIAIINDYKTDKQRQELFDLVNKGDVRVIMGTTQRLGTGVNMQERLAVEHDLDAPFRPADAEQRTGRLVRQGNILPEVEVLRYGMEETLDAGMYQILTRKQKFINDALKGRRRNMDELNDSAVDYASFSAQISGNPMLMRKVELETRLRELQALEYQFRRSIRRDMDLKAELQRAIPHIEEDIIKLKELAAHPFSTEFPEIEINGIKLDGTTEYKVKQLTSHMMQKGLFPALQKAKADFEDTIIPAGFVKINGIECDINERQFRILAEKLENTISAEDKIFCYRSATLIKKL